jgi:hypothetical protein
MKNHTKFFFNKKANFIYLLAFAMPLAFHIWVSLINNFSIEVANFSGKEIGILQSLREIPGFLAFLVIYLLLVISQQRLAIISLLVLGVGVAITGLFPSIYGLYITTVIMSIGFHYLETIQQSIMLQWIPKKIAPIVFARVVSIKSFAIVVSLTLLYICISVLHLDYKYIYIFFGSIAIILAIIAGTFFKDFKSKIEQKKHIVLKKKYWLFYMLTFLSGARRQIFVVFAGFLLVEKFGMPVSDIVVLYFISSIINMFSAKYIGRFISIVGERITLHLEYIGLIVIFISYAFVDNIYIASALYILDFLLFAMAIAIKTYFQKIADPEDLASSAGVSFTINHIGAVFLPFFLGLIWVKSYSLVFLIGAGICFISLIFSFMVPVSNKNNYLSISIKKSKQTYQA